MKKTGLFALLLLSGLAAACNTNDNKVVTPTPVPASAPSTPAPELTPTVAPSPERTVSNTRTVENKDGSTTVIKTYADGSTSEERTFKRGQLARVTRETSSSGASTARVTYRNDNREVEVKDESWVKRAMNATGDALATAATKTKEGAVAVGEKVGDKSGDAYDATKKGVKKGAEVTKKGAVVAADKTGDAYDATKKGVKKGAEVTKKGAREVGDKAEDVGEAAKKGVKKIGSKIKDAVQ